MYCCNLCDLITSKLTDYNRHVLTNKHKKNVIINQNQQIATTIEQSIKCKNCNKYYKERSGLWRHLKKCKDFLSTEPQKEELNKNTNTLVLDTSTVLEFMKQNQEFKSLILEQQNKIIELSNKPNTINNTNNTNNFNLNFFLNETCKDAMNINDFIQNLNIQLKELENVGNNGYVVGISDIIVSRIKGLEISKRPLHCTDAKRETMYIKNENEWNKDNEDKSKLKNIIGQVAKENMRKIPEWREQNPECQDMHNTKYEYCMKLMRNSLGELDEKQDKMDEKIIKNIAKQVTIDK